MLSRMNSIVVVVLAVLVVAAGFATVARADTLYAAWKQKSVVAYDLATAGVVPPSFPLSGVTHTIFGVAVSPLNGDIYMAAEYEGVYRYSHVDGSQVGGKVYSSGNPWGMCFDSSGNLYLGPGTTGLKGTITKIDADGTIHDNWGASGSGTNMPSDLEIFNGKLYGSSYNNPNAVVCWDLATGGTPTTVAPYTTYLAGLCFAPDGTMYTNGLNAAQVRKWDPQPGGVYDLAHCTVLTGVPTSNQGWDIDYWNGSLYMGARSGSPQCNTIFRCDNPTAGSPTWTTFITGNANTSYNGPQFDIVVPEPGTLALLACGLVGLLCYAWRKRK